MVRTPESSNVIFFAQLGEYFVDELLVRRCNYKAINVETEENNFVVG